MSAAYAETKSLRIIFDYTGQKAMTSIRWKREWNAGLQPVPKNGKKALPESVAVPHCGYTGYQPNTENNAQRHNEGSAKKLERDVKTYQ